MTYMLSWSDKIRNCTNQGVIQNIRKCTFSYCAISSQKHLLLTRSWQVPYFWPSDLWQLNNYLFHFAIKQAQHVTNIYHVSLLYQLLTVLGAIFCRDSVHETCTVNSLCDVEISSNLHCAYVVKPRTTYFVVGSGRKCF